ncbi:MAG: glycosyltransferase family 2 protein [Marinilabiliales bacterium]
MNQNTSIKISTVIITFNEEKNIRRCLQSVIDVSDEIIVIDSFSTDKTEEICKDFNVRFVTRQFEGYSESKNFGISLAKHEYILSVDADELISDKLKEDILLVKNNPVYDAYYVNRLNNYCGKWIKHCGWYPDRKIRLWKKGLGLWKGTIHEIVDLTTENIGYLKGDLLHYSYYSISDHLKQIEKFTEIASEDEAKQGKNASIIKILVAPVWKFFKDYIIRLGFLDGYYGYIVCKMSAYATFIKYVKIRQKRKNPKS